MQQAFGEVFYICNAVGDAPPKEHSHLRGVECASESGHNLLGHIAAAAVGVDVGLAMPFFAVSRQGFGCGELYTSERTAVDVALDFEYPRNESGIGDTHTHTPTRHVVALGHRIELYAAIFGIGNLHQREALFGENERIGIVVDDNDVVFLCKRHQTLISLTTCTPSGGHVGIVGPHEFHTAQVHLLQLIEIGLPSIILPQVVVHDLSSKNLGK